MTMKALVVLVLCCIGAYAQTPKPCQSPPRWEGKRLQVDRERDYRSYTMLTYDSLNQRLRMVEQVQVGDETEELNIIHLYRESKEYIINMKTQKCNVTTNIRPWRPYGVPQTAKFDGSALIGAAAIPGENLVVNNFSGRLSPNVTFAGVVTENGCIPIQLDYMDTYTGKLNVEHNTFYDITPGIKDVSVFTPPAQCTPP